jgi:hypothetical protein
MPILKMIGLSLLLINATSLVYAQRMALPDSLIPALELRLTLATSDSERTNMNLELAKAYFVHSYKNYTDSVFRFTELAKGRAVLSKMLAQKKNPDAEILECAFLLEAVRFRSEGDAAKTIDTCYKQLMYHLERQPEQVVAAMVFASLQPVIGRVGGFKRFVAKLFYAPLPEADYDKALLYMLQVKFKKAFMVFTYFRLAELYLALENRNNAIESLTLCLNEPEQIPYFDAHWKSEAAKLKARLQAVKQK